ncbi:MAG: sulfur carrier protein ThiS [Campylobacterales bacterium]|nr:sulfur carrier protein ThiS [Campylobacterales bacterium]
MQVKVNGEMLTCTQGASLEALIAQLELEGKVMAAAVNMQVIKQAQWGEYTIAEGDTVELLDFVGGG